MKDNDALFRRAAFLLSEARHQEKRDQVITFTMRVLSNYATIGMDASSSKIKDYNCRVSSGAADLMADVGSLGDWHKLTVNEHPLPLKVIWSRIMESSDSFTPFDVWNLFVEHPMVTLTKVEDTALSKNGLRSSFSPDRYSSLGIEILQLNVAPKDSILHRLGSN